MSFVTGTGSEPYISIAGPRDYYELLKPRVMSLVIYTAIGGVLIVPGPIHPVLAIAAILAIAAGAGASGALNMWYDADIDAVMHRTRKRPIPSGRVTRPEALAFGLTLAGFSVFTLGIVANWFAASLLAFTIFYYAIIYSMWLKRATPQNIVIGGAAGAFPPMVAYAAITGTVTWPCVALFALIFIWTPPHFWALALVKSDEYAKAGIPMLPNVAGPDRTRLEILVYSLIMAPTGMLPYLMGFASLFYGVFSGALGLWFVWLAIRIYRVRTGDRANKIAIDLFKYSILYLFLLFAALIVEKTLAHLGFVPLNWLVLS